MGNFFWGFQWFASTPSRYHTLELWQCKEYLPGHSPDRLAECPGYLFFRGWGPYCRFFFLELGKDEMDVLGPNY